MTLHFHFKDNPTTLHIFLDGIFLFHKDKESQFHFSFFHVWKPFTGNLS